MIDEQFRKKVIETLQRGDDLPPDWARSLFPPERREYELTYYGKEREEDIIADTMAMPLQAVSTFGTSDGDWHNMLILGDNLQVLKTLLERKRAGVLCNADGTPGVRLVYIDPPFATKQDFRGYQDQKAYQDKVIGARFIEFLRKRLILIRELLTEDGVLYLHLDSRKLHYLKVILDEVFGEAQFQNEVIWRNTNTHNKADTYGEIHQTILFYSKSPRFLFNRITRPRFKKYVENNYRYEDDRGRYRHSDLTGAGIRDGESGQEWLGYNPSQRGRHWSIPNFVYSLVEDDISGLGVLGKLTYLYEHGFIYSPEREGGQPQIKRYYSRDDGNLVQDIWAYQPYTEGVYAESDEAIDQDVTWAFSADETTAYPTQKPEGLLARMIQASSNPGDLVLDCFAGSGTTCAVAEKLGRRWIAIDCGKLAIYTIQKRMLNLKTEIGQKGRPLQPAAFTLYNAGLYDFSTLRKLSWGDWRFFALQLFNCKDEPHTIGGLRLDGKRQGASVLVFNHLENPGRRIDEQTIAEIHAAIGDKIGRRFFIIAPRNTFDFQQDYVDFDGTRYYALRIPYSFINELHRREFSALQQPSDETDVNAIVDAVGFDFIRPPKVGWKVGVTKRTKRLLPEAYLCITEFESRASIRGQDTRGGLETFSLLMVDLNFDGKVFDLDRVFYRPELEKNDWAILLEPTELGVEIMAVFIDIYGNEARIVIPREQFGVLAEDSAENVLPSPLATEVEGD